VLLEFLEDGDWEGGPLILLSRGRPDEVTSLRKVLHSLATQSAGRVALHDLPFVEARSGVQVFARSTNNDRGVVPLPLKWAFEWELAPSSWANVNYLLEPFAGGAVTGFQFLNDTSGPTLIYSADGKW
jgi:hypothetical protein